MTPQPEFVNHCLELWAGDLAASAAPRAKRMFGGWGLYSGDLFVALILREEMFVKVDTTTRAAFEAAGCKPFIYEANGKLMTLGFWSVPAEAMDSAAFMTPWARLAVQAALRAQAVKAVKLATRTKRVKPRSTSK